MAILITHSNNRKQSKSLPPIAYLGSSIQLVEKVYNSLIIIRFRYCYSGICLISESKLLCQLTKAV
jgi:hypothetical protein